MIDRIGGIVVIVSDQQKAMEFYSQKLGFKIKTDTSFVGIRWIEVGPKDSQSTISLMLPNVQMMLQWIVVVKSKPFFIQAYSTYSVQESVSL
jgi:Glyoxalase/Bleomycin resistance protein/Dioxygenase superfamily